MESVEYLVMFSVIGVFLLIIASLSSTLTHYFATSEDKARLFENKAEIEHAVSEIQVCGPGCSEIIYLKNPVNLNITDNMLLLYSDKTTLFLHPTFSYYNTTELSDIHTLRLRKHIGWIEVMKVE